MALCEAFLSLFELAANKEVLVAHVWETTGEDGVGPYAFPSLSMIRKWKRFKDSSMQSKLREYTLIKKT